MLGVGCLEMKFFYEFTVLGRIDYSIIYVAMEMEVGRLRVSLRGTG